MKRLYFAVFAAALAASGFVSCSFLGPELGKTGSGQISIAIPDWVLAGARQAEASGSSRAIGGAIGYVRVYLEANGSLIKLDGANTYLEKAVSVADNTIELNDVPPQKYILYLSLGADGGPAFRASAYATSSVFTVSAGSTATVDVSRVAGVFQDVSTALDLENGVRMALVNGISYVLANGTLKWNDGTERTANLSGIGAIGLGTGRVLRGDGTFGGEVLWINTFAEGVRPFNPLTKEVGPDITKVSQKGYGDKTKILESGVLNVNDQEGSAVEVAYYQRVGSVGFGTENVGDLDNEIPGWDWQDLYEEFDDPESDLSDLKDLIKDLTTKFIADFHTSGGYGYVLIPSVNNFRIYSALEDDLDALEDEFDLQGKDPEYNDYLDVIKGGDAETNVLKVADGAGTRQSVSQEGAYLFIGTKTGLFYTTVNSDNGIPAGPAAKIGPVRLTDGTNADIVRVRSKTVGGDVWTAALARNGDLFLLKNGPNLQKLYRFHTGLPRFEVGGKVDAGVYGDLLWTSAGLMVSGVNGAVRLNNADLGK